MLGWEFTQKIVAIIGGLIGIATAVAGFVYATRPGFFQAAKLWLSARPKVKRIVRSDDDDLEAIWRLHQNEFIAEVADEFEDLQRWVDEAAEARKKQPVKLDEFLLCAKADGAMLGYLFAQYYPSTQLIFVSYIAIDKEAAEARRVESKIVIQLFYELLKQLHKQGYQWRGMVGEFEVQKIGHLRPHAQVLLRTFQISLDKFCKSAESAEKSHYSLPWHKPFQVKKTSLYRMCIDYKQPILRPEDLGTAVIDASYDQWLVFVPSNPEQVIFRDAAGKVFVEKSLATDVLRLVLLETYFDAFPDNENYKTYLQAEFDKYVANLPSKVELKKNWRVHEPNERDLAKEALASANLNTLAAAKPSSLG